MTPQLHDLKPRQIRLDDPMDISFWIEQSGCTEGQLRMAVDLVGPLPQNVREQLAKVAKEALSRSNA